MPFEVRPAPVFIPGPNGALFAVVYRPESGIPSHHLLVLPPFAEEMNRSRRQFHLLGMALGRRGVGLVVFDLSGTGDSEGEFGDARWEAWLEDGRAVVDWIQSSGSRSIGLLGCRLGALLAASLVDYVGADFRELVLWQPIVNGQTFLNQFLRIRLAAAMIEGKQQKVESMAVLRERLDGGESVEVAGYALSPALAKSIERARLAEMLDAGSPPIVWLEVGAKAGSDVAPASRLEVARLKEMGAEVETETVNGEPFWSLQEITTSPALIGPTCRAAH